MAVDSFLESFERINSITGFITPAYQKSELIRGSNLYPKKFGKLCLYLDYELSLLTFFAEIP